MKRTSGFGLRSWSRFARLGIFLLIVAAVVAPVVGESAGAQERVKTTQIGFVNGTPDAPLVDIYVDSILEVEELAYGESSAVVDIPAGERRVVVTLAGEGEGTPIVESQITLEQGGAYVVANVDLVENAVLRSWRIDLNPVGDDESRLRVIHASPDAPEVDVAVSGGDVLIAGATFETAPDAVAVDSGNYDLEMRPAGSEDVVQSISDVEIPSGMACTVMALGLLGDDGALEVTTIVTPLNLLVPGGVVSTGSGAGAIDRATGGELALIALAFGIGGVVVSRRGLKLVRYDTNRDRSPNWT